MKRVLGLVCITVVAIAAFGGGALYYKHRTAAFVEEIRKQQLTPARLAEAAPHMSAQRMDEMVLVLAHARPAIASSVFYNFLIYNKYSELWRKYKGDAAPASILEIGPGVNLAQGVIATMTGVKRYYGLDIYRHPDFYKRYSYDAAAALLMTVAPTTVRTPATEIYTVTGETVAFNEAKVRYFYPYQSYDIPLSAGSVDYVFSNAVFEHISDPTKTIAAIYRVLPSKGLTVHQIDMRDHYNVPRPLEFLKVDERSWRARFNEKNQHEFMNRWRLPDFIAAFERAGFKVLEKIVTETYPVTETEKKALHADFQKYSLEDLSITSAMILAEKP